MEAELAKIVGKSEDYKVCVNCKSVNWYTREECHRCSGDLFVNITQKWIDNEYDFWMIAQGYTESEADSVLYDV